MEGLEIKIISLNECKSVIDFRIDSNTYKKEYLISDALIKQKNPSTIESISKSVQNFGAYSLCSFINFVDDGIPFLMTENIQHNFIDWDIRKYVDKSSHEMLYKSHCSKGQVLVTMAGEYLGRVAVYDKDFVCSSNQAIAKVSIKAKNPYIISTFLNSKHGQNQIQRFKTITGQPNINMSLIKNLLIPDFSEKISSHISLIVQKSEEVRKESYYLYKNSEDVLLSEIGFDGFVPSADNINTKAYSDSFLSSGRLDSEYYLPKYEQVVGHIRKGKFDTLSNLVTIKKSIEPGSSAYAEEGLPFIRVSDYNKFGITTPDKYLSDAYYKENADTLSKLKPKKETILFSKDGSVGIAHMLTEDLNGVTSGAILHLHVKDKKEILPEYLTLVLNSQLVQMQAERDAGGSIILHWRVGEIENVVVPIISMDKQKEIKDMINQSFDAKAKSESLLEIAKRAVEIAIEQDETIAEKYIQDECLRLGVSLDMTKGTKY